MAHRLRVCHFVSDDAWGGAEAMVLRLLSWQKASEELELHLLALNEGELVRRSRSLGLSVHVVAEGGRRFPSLLRDVGRVLQTIEPDIVHSHRYKENLLSYLLARRSAFSCVTTLHGQEDPDSLLRRWRQRAMLRAVHRLGRAVGARYVAVSEDLRRRLGMTERECAVIPNAVDLPPTGALGDRGEPSSPVVGWVGRMVPIKNVELLLRAFASLPPELAAARLLLVGDGPERQSLLSQAERLGLRDRLEARGRVDDPQREYRRMSVFALPSFHEGLPMALLEAMSFGLPCVAARVGGIPEAAAGCEGVRLLEPRDPERWAEALAHFLREPDEASRVGSLARSRVAESFGIERIARAYRQLYSRAAGQLPRQREEGAATPPGAARGPAAQGSPERPNGEARHKRAADW